MARQYLPAADGRVVMVGRAQADVMSLLEARLHLIFTERMACSANATVAQMFATDAADLLWAIGEAEARVAEREAA